MNATPPVFLAQRGNDATQLNAPASAASEGSHAGSRDFAATLNDAGGKPARKNSTNKVHEAASSGSQLPSPGNPPPPAVAPPPPARTEASSATQNGSAVGDVASATRGGAAQGAAVNPQQAAGATPGNASGDAPTVALRGQPVAASLIVPASVASAPPRAANAALPNAAALAPTLATAAVPTGSAAPTAVRGVAGAPTAIAGAAAAPVAVASVAVASVAVVRDAKPVDGAASKAAIAATPSGSTSTAGNAAALNNTTPNGGPPLGATDAAAQAAMAAAIAQSSGPPTDSSLPVDGFQVPNAGIASRGAAGANAAAGSAPAAAPASPSPAGATSAAVTAATAASIAQAVSDEKHSHGGGPDSSLSGTSNDGTAGAAQLLSTSSASTDASSMPTLKVSPGVDTAEFGQGVADRVSVMMDSNLTSAKLQVNPPSLGPIEVRIALQAGHAQVWFTSHSAVTRDALESTTPKLREMLGEQGFAQVSVDISQRSFQERTPQPKGYEAVPGIGSDSTAAVQSTVVARPVNGLLDAYA